MVVLPSAAMGASPFQLGLLDPFFAAICLIAIASVVVFILVAVWLYRDAESRGMQGGLWVAVLILASLFLTFIGGLIVLVIYLILRSERPVRYPGYPGYVGYPGYPPPYSAPVAPPGPPGAPAPPPPAPTGVAPAPAPTCRHCGAPAPAGAAYCVRCGSRL